jgi:hypothetical protein
MATNNLFKLFDDVQNWREAELALKAVCREAAEKIVALVNNYEECGAGDTDSRYAITDHIWELILEIDADHAKETNAKLLKGERRRSTNKNATEKNRKAK